MMAHIHVKVGGLTSSEMGLMVLLLSLFVDTVVAVNEDGDTFQLKQNKHSYQMERGPRLTENVYGVPVTIDNLFEQIISLPTDDQAQNAESECHAGHQLSEMDMCLTPAQAGMFALVSFTGQTGKRTRRQASANGFSLWKSGVIPYVLNSTFPSQDRDAILSAMSEWEKTTCIRFRPANRDDTDLVIFRDGRRCSTNIGRIGRAQTVTLAKTCRSKRILIHELGHVIGLIHEHQRHDRDKYVKVLMENVRNMSQERYQFSKLLSGSITDRAVKYDYTSVMHYGRNYFAKSPELTTLQTTESTYQDVIGRAEKPSYGDTETVNRLYKCSAGCPPLLQCDESCYMDSLCSCRCPAAINKANVNGPGPFRNSLLDSTCEFFASRGECTGNLKDTVRPLCAKTCELHQPKYNTLPIETQTQAPNSNINHLQSKPISSPWGTNPDTHGLIVAGRNMHFYNNEMNNLNDVTFLRSTEVRLPSPVQLSHQHDLSSQQPYLQDQLFLPMSDTHSQARSQQLQQNMMNAPFTDNLRAALQQQVTYSASEPSFLRALILSSSSTDKISRLFTSSQNNGRSLQMGERSEGSKSVPLLRQETTKTPSIILEHLLHGESRNRQDHLSGLSVWLGLSHGGHRQQQHNQPHNYQTARPTTVASSGRQMLQDVYGLTHVRAGGLPTAQNNNWQVDASFSHRNSEAGTINSQITEITQPDPYHPGGHNAMLPSGDYGVSDQGPKVLEPNIGLVTAGVDRINDAMTSADFTGPENIQPGASISGTRNTNNSNGVMRPDVAQNLQSTGPSFMKNGVVPQNLVVSEQNPPLGSPVEQVFYEPWNMQMHQTSPLTEQQPPGQTFQYRESHQTQYNLDHFSEHSVQLGQQQIETLDFSNQGSSTANTEAGGDTLSFQNYQDPIDHQALEALQSSHIFHSYQNSVPADISSSSGNFASEQQQQMSPFFQLLNMHQSFTDPMASNLTFELGNTLPTETQNTSVAVTEVIPSQNLSNSVQNPELDSLHHVSSHVPTVDSLSDANCCLTTQTNTATAQVNETLQLDSPQASLINGSLPSVDSDILRFPAFISGFNLDNKYLKWISGQFTSLYSVPSMHRLKSNSTAQSESTQADQQTLQPVNDSFGQSDTSNYHKHTGHYSTPTGDPGKQGSQHIVITESKENVQPHLGGEINGFVQPISQTNSRTADNNSRLSLARNFSEKHFS